MESEYKAHINWLFLWIHSLVISTVTDAAQGAPCNWSVSAPPTVDRVLGGHVVLPCSFTVNNGDAIVYNVIWTTSSNNLTQIKSNVAPSTPTTNTWGDRASLTDQASLRLNSITQQDGGQYTCEVTLLFSTGCSVSAGKQTDTSLVVKVPPSPPRVSTSSNGTVNRDVVENRMAYLYCENFNGSPPVNYTWRRGSQVLSGSMESGTYELTVTNIKRDATTYTCTVTNSAGTNSATFTFNVLYPSGAASAVSTSVVKVTGQSTSLQCRVTQQGNPAVTFRWTKDSDTTVIESNAGTLYKSNLQVSDDGTYHCTPVNTAGSGTPASIVLTVNVPPSITPAVPSAMTVTVRQNLRLECTATAKPAATVQWTMSTGVALPSAVFETETPAATVNGKITTSKSILKWKSGSSASTRKSAGDEVRLKCTANNGVGNQAEGNARIIVQYPPGTPQLTISSTSPQINTDVTLTCSLPQSQRGNPATYMYTWRKGNVELSTSVPPNHSNMFTMRVDNINDAADYTCEARNSAGAGSSPSSTQAISVVNVPVFIHSPNSPQTLSPLFNDSHFKVECIYSGNPTPADDAVVWKKDGAGITDLTKYNVTTVQVTQSFSYGIRIGKKSMIKWNKSLVDFSCGSVAEYDGRYQCSVNSGTSGQDMSSEVTVRTKYSPKLRGLNTVAAQLRDNKTIVCDVCASPTPSSYAWYFGNETNSRGSGGNLTISNIQKNNFGTYICKVTNEVGEEKIGFELKPEGPPEPPVSMTATEITSRTITLKWVPGYDGGYPQSFVVKYKKVSEDGTAYQTLEEIPQGIKQELSVIVQNLNASTQYRISIQAKNSRLQLPNTSSRTESDFITADLPSVELQSVVYNGEELTVVWKLLKGNPTKYSIQYIAVDDTDFLDLVTDIPASHNNATVTISLTQSSYVFRIIAYEGEAATVDTQQEPRPFNLRNAKLASTAGVPVVTATVVTVTTLILTIFAVIIVVFLRRRRCRTNSDNEDKEGVGTEMNEIPSVEEGTYEKPQNGIEKTSIYTFLHKEKKRADDDVPTYAEVQKRDTEFARENIKINAEIGSGAFGLIFKGEIYGFNGKGEWVAVAVKTVKDPQDSAIVKYLMNELKVMQEIGPHPNIVSLLGSCTRDGGLPMIVMEYLPNGNLQTFLRNDRSQKKAVYGNLFGISSTLTSRDLMKFALDVTNGMSFLSSLSILHRDLAARNILLSDDRTCKISDFGFARDVIESHQYERKSEGRLPIRWMSPEALYDNMYTTQSDVWAYGVLLWEIVTLGSSPYPGMSAKQVMEAITEGYRMPQPPHCSLDMYIIMLSCWEEAPAARPSFDEIANSLNGLLNLDCDVLTLGKFEDRLYEDIDKYKTDEKC